MSFRLSLATHSCGVAADLQKNFHEALNISFFLQG